MAHKVKAIREFTGNEERQLYNMATQLMGRAQLAAKLGKSYGGQRDLYLALGYSKNLTYADYYGRYKRQDVAKRIVKAPVDAVWRKKPTISESKEDETEFEKAWKQFIRKHNPFHYLSRADRISGIGRFGILLIGFDDGEQDLKQPVGSAKEVLYLRPYSEDHVEIKTSVTDRKDVRYGLPDIYTVQVTATVERVESGMPLDVHHSRILHIAEDVDENDMFGTPRLECVYNRLQDLELIAGGSAEMFWRGALPGYAFKADEGYEIKDPVALEKEIESWIHDLKRYVRLTGVTVENLAPQVADPKGHFDILIALISAATAIPKRILLGSERGELSSGQDATNWDERIQQRQIDYVEPMILRPFIDRLIEFGVLPKLGEDGYQVEWPNLLVLSEKDQATVVKSKTDSFVAYSNSSAAQIVIPAQFYLERFLGLSQDDIDQIEAIQKTMIDEEAKQIKEEEAGIALEEEAGIALEEEEAARIALEEKRTKTLSLGNMLTTEEIFCLSEMSKKDWKKAYKEGSAHWAEDLQSSIIAQNFIEQISDKTIRGKKILEIGCGNGRDSILFTYAGLKVTAVDFIPEAITLAKKNAKGAGVAVDFQEGNAEGLIFKDNFFNFVFSLSVLHATDLSKSISEARRVLKKNGLSLIHIYSDVQKINGGYELIISINDFIKEVQLNNFQIEDIYTTTEDEYDEVGEKHLVIVAKLKGI